MLKKLTAGGLLWISVLALFPAGSGAAAGRLTMPGAGRIPAAPRPVIRPGSGVSPIGSALPTALGRPVAGSNRVVPSLESPGQPLVTEIPQEGVAEIAPAADPRSAQGDLQNAVGIINEEPSGETADGALKALYEKAGKSDSDSGATQLFNGNAENSSIAGATEIRKSNGTMSRRKNRSIRHAKRSKPAALRARARAEKITNQLKVFRGPIFRRFFLPELAHRDAVIALHMKRKTLAAEDYLVAFFDVYGNEDDGYFYEVAYRRRYRGEPRERYGRYFKRAIRFDLAPEDARNALSDEWTSLINAGHNIIDGSIFLIYEDTWSYWIQFE